MKSLSHIEILFINSSVFRLSLLLYMFISLSCNTVPCLNNYSFTGVGCHFLLQGTSQPRDQTQVSHIVDRRFIVWATREVIYYIYCVYYIWILYTVMLLYYSIQFYTLITWEFTLSILFISKVLQLFSWLWSFRWIFKSVF